jgi:hypothetical protein
MPKKWVEACPKVLAIVLLLLAAVNGWIAHAIFPKHPIMALANGAMAVVIVLGVALFWGAGRSG